MAAAPAAANGATRAAQFNLCFKSYTEQKMSSPNSSCYTDENAVLPSS